MGPEAVLDLLYGCCSTATMRCVSQKKQPVITHHAYIIVAFDDAFPNKKLTMATEILIYLV